MRKDMPCEIFNFAALSTRPGHETHLTLCQTHSANQIECLEANQIKCLELRSQVLSWLVRIVVVAMFVGVSEYSISRVTRGWDAACNHDMHVQFWFAVVMFFVVLLSWELFLVENIPKVLRMWCMVLAVGGNTFPPLPLLLPTVAEMPLDRPPYARARLWGVRCLAGRHRDDTERLQQPRNCSCGAGPEHRLDSGLAAACGCSDGSFLLGDHHWHDRVPRVVGMGWGNELIHHCVLLSL